MARKKQIKWTPKLENFVLDKIASGMKPAHIFKQYADELPSLASFSRKQVDDIDFRAKVDSAYFDHYQSKAAELENLSTGLASEIYPNAEFREAEAALKRRIDALKFDLGKMAGLFTQRYDKKQVIEHQGEVQNAVTFVLPDYLKMRQERIIEDEDKR